MDQWWVIVTVRCAALRHTCMVGGIGCDGMLACRQGHIITAAETQETNRIHVSDPRDDGRQDANQLSQRLHRLLRAWRRNLLRYWLPLKHHGGYGRRVRWRPRRLCMMERSSDHLLRRGERHSRQHRDSRGG